MSRQYQEQLIEQAVLSTTKAMEDKLDEEIQKLGDVEVEDEMELLRARRMMQMRENAAKKQKFLSAGHGNLTEVPEKEFFGEIKKSRHVVCHFFRGSNRHCHILDEHLTLLARKHLETRFLKVDAEKSPFLTEKLGIWMLPTLTLIQDSKVVDHIVGLDELGGDADFSTKTLEWKLASLGVIDPPQSSSLSDSEDEDED